jgi:hypothetical protein
MFVNILEFELLENKNLFWAAVFVVDVRPSCRCLPATRPSCSDPKRNVWTEQVARFPQRLQSVAGI